MLFRSEGLSDTLRAAFEEHELYNLYIYFLAADNERAKALLEVFDKVCPGSACYSVNAFLKIIVRHRLLQPRNVT